MRATLLGKYDVVTNVIEVGEGYEPPEGLKLGPGDGEIGWRWNGTRFDKPLVLVAPPTLDEYAAAIQGHVDATARERGYADGVALASYKGSGVAKWASEAEAFIVWRDAVWLAAYALLEAVKAGELKPPPIEKIITKLPVITWPA